MFELNENLEIKKELFEGTVIYTIDDFYKNRTLGTIDGIEYSPSDFIDPFDKEKLNTILNNMGN